MYFMTEDGKNVRVRSSEIQATRFFDDGDVMIVYTAGDCDAFLPYVTI